MINGIDIKEYKEHPRIAEIRFVLLFDMFEKEFGYNKAVRIYEAICECMDCNMRLLQDLINKRYEIKRRSKVKFIRWRQEVLFCAHLYDETIYSVAKNYFHVTPMTIYQQKDIYSLENFISRSWLRELDNEVAISGLKQYRIEIKRFMEAMNNLATVLYKWRGGR